MIALAITMIALAITSQTAYAASTRADYVAQADPMCQATHVAEKGEQHRFKERIGRLIRHGLDPDRPTKPALRETVIFANRAARIARRGLEQIAAIPPPPGDEMTVSEWLRLKGKQTNYFQRALHAFARNQKPHQFKRLQGRSDDAGLDAEGLFQDWGFQYCASSS